MYQLVVNDHKNVTRLQEFMDTINSWLRRSLVTRYISDMTALQMNLGCDVQTYRLVNLLTYKKCETFIKSIKSFKTHSSMYD